MARCVRKTSLSFCITVALVVVCTTLSQREAVFAQTPQPKPQGNVINLYGAPVGAVDDNGNVFTPYGSKLGCVGLEGRIYNVSNILVGKVYPNGDIFNQAGDFLGYVDAEGNVYNMSEIKIGSVQVGGNPILAGAAARIIFFKSSKGSGSKRPPLTPRPR